MGRNGPSPYRYKPTKRKIKNNGPKPNITKKLQTTINVHVDQKKYINVHIIRALSLVKI